MCSEAVVIQGVVGVIVSRFFHRVTLILWSLKLTLESMLTPAIGMQALRL